MSHRLAALLALSLTTTTLTSTAAARSFARAPEAEPAGAPRMVRLDEDGPRISPRARARLRKVLAAHRARNVAAFRAYARRGIYPHNYTTSGALNVWTDEEGRLCAAATMIFRSGAKRLVRDIGRNANHIRLGDVTEGPVMDWILTSGLTQAEIAAIQEPFMGRMEPEPIEPVEPAPAPDPGRWKLAEDQRLRARYTVVLADLASYTEASLDAALDTLASRPDLVAQLLRG